MDLPWSEEYMLRQSYPSYDNWCRDDDSEFLGDDPKYTAELERANYE